MTQQLIDELKVQAKLLHKRLSRSPAEQYPELRKLLIYIPENLQLKHCLQAISRFHGWSEWQQVADLAAGKSQDFGAFWYRSQCIAYLNHWFNSYQDAKSFQRNDSGYLLPYQSQFLVVSAQFIQALGTKVDEPQWQTLGKDIVLHPNHSSTQVLAAMIARRFSPIK